MRSDLNKLLCERERRGSSNSYSAVRHHNQFDMSKNDVKELIEDHASSEDGELASLASSGSRESMKKRHHVGWNTKEFNENLNPLFGFVRKNVGRPWNKVYGELRAVFDARSVINQHILQHLNEYVEQDDILVATDGSLQVRRSYSLSAESLEDSFVEYYVDPRDGILKQNKHHKTYKQRNLEAKEKAAAAKFLTRRSLDNFTELRKIDDIWFEVKFIEQPGTQIRQTYPSAFGRRPSYSVISPQYPEKFDVLLKTKVCAKRIAVSRRTLSHKELKQHNLIEK